MKFVRLKEVLNITGLSRSVLYCKLAEGSFPKAILLSSNTVAWRSSDLQEWIISLIKNRDNSEKGA